MKALQRKGLYFYLLPTQVMARQIVWKGSDNGGRAFIEFIPKKLVVRKSEQEMSLTLSNGSIIQLVGADNPDRLRGVNAVGLVVSEAAFIAPEVLQTLNPVLAANGGWQLINSTPRGKNHFYHMLNEAKANKDWYASHLPVTKTKAVSPAELRKSKEEMRSDAMWAQEWLASFEVPVEGSYYGPIIHKLYKKKQILDHIAPEPSLPVHTGWDLGMSDSTSIWLFQQYQKEIRIVGYYENSGEGLPHYAQWLREWAALHDVSFGKHYVPHDSKVREMGSGKSRIEIMRKLGIRGTVVKKLSIMDGIEAVRNVLPRCWFSTKGTGSGLEHMKSYTKEGDEKTQTFKKQPRHDQHSHGADAFRTLAVGLRETSTISSKDRKERSQYKDTPLDW